MIEIKDITLGYGRKILLENISAKLGKGELTALLGRNGSGKSTLIRTLAGLQKPYTAGGRTGGEILIGGRDIRSLSREEAARTVSFVGTERILVPDLKGRELVAMGRAPWTGWTGRPGAKDEEMTDRAIELVGMQEYAMTNIAEMSDGERQKIMIARALAQDTPVMLLDEPTAFLDVPGKHQTVSILRKAASEEGKCVIFSTHDVETAVRSADKVLLADGRRVILLRCGVDPVMDEIRRVFGI